MVIVLFFIVLGIFMLIRNIMVFKERKRIMIIIHNLSEKDIEKVDKEYLSKAKDSRDLIDKKLRTFENSIENISDTIKDGETEPEKKGDKEDGIERK